MSENGRVSNGPDDPVRTKILKIDIWLEARECQAPYAWGGRLVSALGGALLTAETSLRRDRLPLICFLQKQC